MRIQTATRSLTAAERNSTTHRDTMESGGGAAAADVDADVDGATLGAKCDTHQGLSE